MGCNQRKFVSLDFIAHKSTLYVPLNVAPINIVDKWNKTLFAGKPSPGELNWTMSGGYLTRKKNGRLKLHTSLGIVHTHHYHLNVALVPLATNARSLLTTPRFVRTWNSSLVREREWEGEGIEISAGLLREIHSFFIRLHFLFMAARYELMDDDFFLVSGGTQKAFSTKLGGALLEDEWNFVCIF